MSAVEGLCAIQCKNYAEDHKVPTKDINSFLATSEDASLHRAAFWLSHLIWSRQAGRRSRTLPRDAKW